MILDVLIGASVRILAVATLVALILMVMRVRASGVRHAAWTLVLVAMMLMPVLPAIVPVVTVPLPVRTEAVLPPALFPPEAPVDVRSNGAERVGPSAARFVIAPAGPVVPERPSARPGWALWPVAIAVYLVVAVGLLFRLLAGWRAVARLARTSASVSIDCCAPVLESALVATPVTAGVFTTRIILPRGWAEWPPEKLRACLAHETAHVRRRDTLIAFLAQINRCVFWFHPLAWWLERTLAASAEDAADEAAIMEIGSRRRYAEVLLDIAEAVRLRGSRVAWQGVGAGGSGRLGRRLDRVLRGNAGPEMSRRRKATVFAACATVVLIVVACRQQAAVPPPLQPDPEVAARLEKQKADRVLYDSAAKMTAAEVDALEASLKQTPGDLEALRKLRRFYEVSGQKVFGWDQMIARRRPHILWVVENRPEDDLAIWPVSAEADPVSYAEVKARWLAQTAKPDASEKVLRNAAFFLQRSDPQIAEQMLLRAKGNISAPDRLRALSSRLGTFYADVMKGPTSPRDGSPLTPLDSTPYARDVRERVAQSTDPVLLRDAGRMLAITFQDEERQQLGLQLLRRALELDPQLSDVRMVLADMEDRDRLLQRGERIRNRAASLAGADIAAKLAAKKPLTREEQMRVHEARPQAIAEEPEAERFVLLASSANGEYMAAESFGWNKDTAAADRAYARSKQYGLDALALAQKFRDDPDYGKAFYDANVALAVNALREGDGVAAVRYMREAVKAPPSPAFARRSFGGLDVRLMNYMLKEGERESVAEFLERSAELRPVDREQLLKNAAAIRAGRMPASYQSMLSK
jgi:hypothetical protein